jgi:hypothetical protein
MRKRGHDAVQLMRKIIGVAAGATLSAVAFGAPALADPGYDQEFLPSTPSSCSPQTKKGNCYEPGEICRKSDHGASGVAGDGESIVCKDNDGWRWEPA